MHEFMKSKLKDDAFVSRGEIGRLGDMPFEDPDGDGVFTLLQGLGCDIFRANHEQAGDYVVLAISQLIKDDEVSGGAYIPLTPDMARGLAGTLCKIASDMEGNKSAN